MVFLTLGDLRPWVFRGFRELFAMSRIDGNVTTLWMLGRNVGGTWVVAVQQCLADSSPLLGRRMLVVVKRGVRAKRLPHCGSYLQHQ